MLDYCACLLYNYNSLMKMGDCAPFFEMNSLKLHKNPVFRCSCGTYNAVKYMEE